MGSCDGKRRTTAGERNVNLVMFGCFCFKGTYSIHFLKLLGTISFIDITL